MTRLVCWKWTLHIRQSTGLRNPVTPTHISFFEMCGSLATCHLHSACRERERERERARAREREGEREREREDGQEILTTDPNDERACRQIHRPPLRCSLVAHLVCCSVLECVAVYSRVLQCCNVGNTTARGRCIMCCRVWECIAVC